MTNRILSIFAAGLGWMFAWQAGLISSFIVYASIAPIILASGASMESEVANLLRGLFSGLVGGLVGGAMAGLGQWYAHRKHIGFGAGWIPATMVCFGIALAGAWAIAWPHPYEGGVREVIIGGGLGTLGSLTQFITLSASRPRLPIWFFASLASWLACFTLTLLWPNVPIIGDFAAGLMLGIISHVLITSNRPRSSAT